MGDGNRTYTQERQPRLAALKKCKGIPARMRILRNIRPNDPCGDLLVGLCVRIVPTPATLAGKMPDHTVFLHRGEVVAGLRALHTSRANMYAKHIEDQGIRKPSPGLFAKLDCLGPVS